MTIEVLDVWTVSLFAPGSTSTHDLPEGVSLQEGDVLLTLSAGLIPPHSFGWINDDAQSWLPNAINTGASIGRGDGTFASVGASGVYYGSYGNTSIDYEYLGDNVGPLTMSFLLVRGAQYTYLAQSGTSSGTMYLPDGDDPYDECDTGEAVVTSAWASGVPAGSIAIAAGIAALGPCDTGTAAAISGGPGWTNVSLSQPYHLEYTASPGSAYSVAYGGNAASPCVTAMYCTLWLAPYSDPYENDVVYNPNDAGSVANVIISDNTLEGYGIETGIVLENVFYGVVSGNHGYYATLNANYCSYIEVAANNFIFAYGAILNRAWHFLIAGNHVVALSGQAAFTLGDNCFRNTITGNKANAWRDYQLIDHAVILAAGATENVIAFNDFTFLYDVSQVDDSGTDNIILLNLPETTVEAGAIALDDLTDVNAAGATDGQALVYDDGTGTWIPATISAGAVASLDDVGDVDVATVTDGQLLAWDEAAGNWVPVDPGVGSGDMAKATYDLNDNGVVDAAESVPWSGITDVPTTFPPEAHSHTVSDISDFPTEFPPSAHTHSVTDITDFPAIPANLDDLADVSAAAPSNGQVLSYDDGTGTWVAADPAAGGATAIDDLSDVDTTGVADGQFLQWDEAGGNWVPGTPSGAGDMLASVYDANGNNIVDAAESVPWAGITDAPTEFPPEAHTHALADLSDVDVTGVTDGYTLVYSAGEWVAAEPTVTPGSTVDIGQLHEHAYAEDHSGECNGSLLTVILANEFSPGTAQVWLNGLRQRPGRDYDETGYDAIVFSTAPLAGDDLLIDYEVA